jgi:hypothetical protein
MVLVWPFISLPTDFSKYQPSYVKPFGRQGLGWRIQPTLKLRLAQQINPPTL